MEKPNQKAIKKSLPLKQGNARGKLNNVADKSGLASQISSLRDQTGANHAAVGVDAVLLTAAGGIEE